MSNNTDKVTEDDSTYTQLLLNNVQANSLIKILLDRVNDLEWQLFQKQSEVDGLKVCEDKLHDIEKAYDALQDELWALKKFNGNSQPPPFPKVDISKANDL